MFCVGVNDIEVNVRPFVSTTVKKTIRVEVRVECVCGEGCDEL